MKNGQIFSMGRTEEAEEGHESDDNEVIDEGTSVDRVMASDSDANLNDESIHRSFEHNDDDVGSSSDISIDGDEEKEAAAALERSDDPLGSGRPSSRMTVSSSSSSLSSSRQPIAYNDHWPKYFGLAPRGFQFVDHAPSTSTGCERIHPDCPSEGSASPVGLDGRWTSNGVDRRNSLDKSSNEAVARHVQSDDLLTGQSDQPPHGGLVVDDIAVCQPARVDGSVGELTADDSVLADVLPTMQVRVDAEEECRKDDRVPDDHSISPRLIDTRRSSQDVSPVSSNNDVVDNERCPPGRMPIDSASTAAAKTTSASDLIDVGVGEHDALDGDEDSGSSELSARRGSAEQSTGTSPYFQVVAETPTINGDEYDDDDDEDDSEETTRTNLDSLLEQPLLSESANGTIGEQQLRNSASAAASDQSSRVQPTTCVQGQLEGEAGDVTDRGTSDELAQQVDVDDDDAATLNGAANSKTSADVTDENEGHSAEHVLLLHNVDGAPDPVNEEPSVDDAFRAKVEMAHSGVHDLVDADNHDVPTTTTTTTEIDDQHFQTRLTTIPRCDSSSEMIQNDGDFDEHVERNEEEAVTDDEALRTARQMTEADLLDGGGNGPEVLSFFPGLNSACTSNESDNNGTGNRFAGPPRAVNGNGAWMTLGTSGSNSIGDDDSSDDEDQRKCSTSDYGDVNGLYANGTSLYDSGFYSGTNWSNPGLNSTADVNMETKQAEETCLKLELEDALRTGNGVEHFNDVEVSQTTLNYDYRMPDSALSDIRVSDEDDLEQCTTSMREHDLHNGDVVCDVLAEADKDDEPLRRVMPECSTAVTTSGAFQTSLATDMSAYQDATSRLTHILANMKTDENCDLLAEADKDDEPLRLVTPECSTAVTTSCAFQTSLATAMSAYQDATSRLTHILANMKTDENEIESRSLENGIEDFRVSAAGAKEASGGGPDELRVTNLPGGVLTQQFPTNGDLNGDGKIDIRVKQNDPGVTIVNDEVLEDVAVDEVVDKDVVCDEVKEEAFAVDRFRLSTDCHNSHHTLLSDVNAPSRNGVSEVLTTAVTSSPYANNDDDDDDTVCDEVEEELLADEEFPHNTVPADDYKSRSLRSDVYSLSLHDVAVPAATVTRSPHVKEATEYEEPEVVPAVGSIGGGKISMLAAECSNVGVWRSTGMTNKSRSMTTHAACDSRADSRVGRLVETLASADRSLTGFLEGDDLWESEKLSIFRSVKLSPGDVSRHVIAPGACSRSASVVTSRENGSTDRSGVDEDGKDDSTPLTKDTSDIEWPLDEKAGGGGGDGHSAAKASSRLRRRCTKEDTLFVENMSLWRRLADERRNYVDELRALQDARRKTATDLRILNIEASTLEKRLLTLELRRHQSLAA